MSWRTSRRRRGREVRNQMSKRPPYTEIQGLCLPWCLVKTLKFVIASSERLNLLSPIYLLCSACFQAKRSQMPSVLSCQSPSSHHMSDGPHNTATTKTPPQSLLVKITTYPPISNNVTSLKLDQILPENLSEIGSYLA